MNSENNELDRHTADPVIESETTDLDALQAQLEAQGRELFAKRQDVLARQQQAREAKLQQMRDERQQLRETAANYRKLAAESNDKEQAEKFLRWAIENEEKAAKILIDGEEPEAQPPAPRQPAWKSITRHRGLALVQLVLLVLMAGWALGMFSEIRMQIIEGNKVLPPEQQAAPYDLTSFQKFFYELFVSFVDVPVALSKLLLITPFVLFYLLSFVKTGKKDFITEFFEDLTPYQRCTLTAVLLSVFLLAQALSHVVKP